MMNKRIDRFMLGLLWLLATTLGGSFWFNTIFGFNIFLTSHWKYLAGLQASGTQIDIMFYISMIVIVFLMIVGLYFIIRPRFRKITISPVTKPEHIIEDKTQNNPIIETKPDNITPIATSLARPPRLNIPNNYISPNIQTKPNAQKPVNTPLPSSSIFDKQIPSLVGQSDDSKKIEEFFKSAGYITKKPPKIEGVNPDLFAIGMGEILWIGGMYIAPNKMNKAVEKLRSIFLETLDDIEINIKSFIVNPPGNLTSEFTDINIFDSLDSLNEYIKNNPAEQVLDSDRDNFQAYSEYIDTVAGYLNKI